MDLKDFLIRSKAVNIQLARELITAVSRGLFSWIHKQITIIPSAI